MRYQHLRYTEYLECAKKHVTAGCNMLDAYNQTGQDDMSVWLDLYYLSGYIIEAVTVYSVYKTGQWNDAITINEHDPAFVSRKNVDFYGSDCNLGTLRHPNFPYRAPGVIPPYAIKSHRFGPIITNVLRPDPTFNTIPYLGSCDPADIDSDIVDLLDDWDVRVRYERPSSSSIVLSKDLIKRLYKTCLTIVMKVSTEV